MKNFPDINLSYFHIKSNNKIARNTALSEKSYGTLEKFFRLCYNE